MRFVDTNVLIYAASPAPDEATKQRSAQRLLEAGDLALSVQVLQEFYHQVTRPTRPTPLTQDHALQFIASLGDFPVQAITLDVFRNAVAISRRFRLSYWDGAILAAATAAGCDAVYSEDMNAEQDYGGVRVINPFSEPDGGPRPN
ncbi:MAG: PIN domain-containing protein [Gammaproteobacteria bacterium]|nr:PIN domain-containing protein [Gammaproteobacteria bacterium]